MKVRVNAKKAARWAKILEGIYLEALGSDAVSDAESEALDAVLDPKQYEAVFNADRWVPLDQVFEVQVIVRPRSKQDYFAKSES